MNLSPLDPVLAQAVIRLVEWNDPSEVGSAMYWLALMKKARRTNRGLASTCWRKREQKLDEGEQ
jgi:hypothetical protein